MPATRPTRTHTSSSDKLDKLDLSRASPTTHNPTIPNNLTNDSGSATLGVGVGGVGKGKRQPLKRSAGSAGSGTGSGQSLLGFSSRKAGPVTPEKKKTSGLKRRFGEVVIDLEEQEDGSTIGAKVPITNTNIHPVFAVPERPTNSTTTSTLTIPETTITTTTTTLSTTNETVQGISGVPQNGAWDPLLLSRTNPTKEMENNLSPPPSFLPGSRAGLTHGQGQDLGPEPTEEEQMEEQVDDDAADDDADGVRRTRTRTINGLAVRKAMIRADEKIRQLRSQKQSQRPFSSLSMPTTTTTAKLKTAAGGKNKVGGSTAKSVKGKNNKKMEEEEEVKVKAARLDPDDRRWKGVYEAAWELMGGDDVAPSTCLVVFLSFSFLSAFPPRFTFFTFGSLFGQSEEPFR